MVCKPVISRLLATTVVVLAGCASPVHRGAVEAGPVAMIDTMLGSLPCLIDFHAEATSEKIAFGWHVDGRATAIVGTHTHVQTADEQILPDGTAYITDVGMSGPHNGVIGMDRSIVVRKFVTGMPAKFEVANGPGVVHGVCITVDAKTHLATDIERIRFAI